MANNLFRTGIKEENKILSFLHKHVITIIIIVVIAAAAIATTMIVKDRIDNENHIEGVTYEKTSTLRFAMTRVDTLNPLISTNEDVANIARLVYDGMFDLDGGLNVVPVLVSTYDADSSGGTVSIKLKKNVKFHSGDKLTANDVKFTVDTIKYIGSKGPYYDYASKIAYVDVNGDRSLVIHFYNSADAALDNLVFPIVSSRQYSSVSEFANATSYKPMGTGKYKYRSYNYLSHLKLSPYKDYFGDAASNSIRFVILPSKTHVTDLMTMDDITAALIKDDNIGSIAEDKHLRTHRVLSNEAEYMGFNFNNRYLANVKMRQAIARAIDLSIMMDDVYARKGVINDSIFYPGFLGSTNGGDPYPYDLASAMKTLEDLGYKDINEDGFVEDEYGNEIVLRILVNSNNITRCEAAGKIEDSLKYIGLNVQIDEQPKDTYQYMLNRRDFDIYLGGCKIEKRYNLKDLLGYGNKLNYNSDEVVNYLNKLETAMDRNDYSSTFSKLKEELIDDIPYYCLYYKNYSLTSVATFRLESAPTFFDPYRYCDTWEWERVVEPEDNEE